MYLPVNHVKLQLIAREANHLTKSEIRDRYHRWATDRINGGKRGLKLSYNICDRRGRHPLNYTLELFFANGESTGLRVCMLCNASVEQKAAIRFLFDTSRYVLSYLSPKSLQIRTFLVYLCLSSF